MVRTRSQIQSDPDDDGRPSSPSKVSRVKGALDSKMPLIKSLGSAFLTIITLIFLLEKGFIRLHGATGPDKLASFGTRLEYALEWAVVPVSFIAYCIVRVGLVRGTTLAGNPLSGHENLVLEKKLILQNTLEQALLSIFSQIMLVCTLTGPYIAKTIPAINLLFIIGRITFIYGYPNKRAFGFALTFWPSIVSIILCLFRLVSEQYYPLVYDLYLSFLTPVKK